MIEPFNQGYINVDTIHSIYFEESGNPNGIPIIRFHGGPGGRLKPKDREVFDSNKYRIILFAQRSCVGQPSCKSSIPLATNDLENALKGNDPISIVHDAEKIRDYLNIDSFHVVGNSAGSFLALLYAIYFPSRVKSLTLLKFFLNRHSDFKWYLMGIGKFFPEVVQRFKNFVNERDDFKVFSKYYELLTSNNSKNIKGALRELMILDSFSELGLAGAVDIPDEDLNNKEILNFYILFLYHSLNYQYPDNWFYQSEVKKILSKIETTIIHGRLDLNCPPDGVFLYKKHYPKTKIFMIEDSGHILDPSGSFKKTTDEYFNKILLNNEERNL